MIKKGFQHGLQSAHDLGERSQQSAAAQLPGVIGVRTLGHIITLVIILLNAAVHLAGQEGLPAAFRAKLEAQLRNKRIPGISH